MLPSSEPAITAASAQASVERIRYVVLVYSGEVYPFSSRPVGLSMSRRVESRVEMRCELPSCVDVTDVTGSVETQQSQLKPLSLSPSHSSLPNEQTSGNVGGVTHGQ